MIHWSLNFNITIHRLTLHFFENRLKIYVSTEFLYNTIINTIICAEVIITYNL